MPGFELKAHVATDMREVLGDYYETRSRYFLYVGVICILLIVGGFLGWQIDLWLDTGPIGLIVFLALGTAAGFWNVYKLAASTTTR